MKITYDARVKVSGWFAPDERRTVGATEKGAARQMLATGFHMELVPGPLGWQARMVTLDGRLLRPDGRPGVAPGLRHYFLTEPDTPDWVRDLVARSMPAQFPPLPTP
ncbi:hypothetical protein [Streptomyces sp. cg35]|uniref:hypothetical protein n=1 Tax=Streptomyces sp. cg35 TaxID=3421650 RepID=UPI003D174EE0